MQLVAGQRERQRLIQPASGQVARPSPSAARPHLARGRAGAAAGRAAQAAAPRTPAVRRPCSWTCSSTPESASPAVRPDDPRAARGPASPPAAARATSSKSLACWLHERQDLGRGEAVGRRVVRDRGRVALAAQRLTGLGVALDGEAAPRVEPAVEDQPRPRAVAIDEPRLLKERDTQRAAVVGDGRLAPAVASRAAAPGGSRSSGPRRRSSRSRLARASRSRAPRGGRAARARASRRRCAGRAPSPPCRALAPSSCSGAVQPPRSRVADRRQQRSLARSSSVVSAKATGSAADHSYKLDRRPGRPTIWAMSERVIYISRITRLPLVGADGSDLGHVVDVVLDLGGKPPRVIGFVVGGVQRRRVFVGVGRIGEIETRGAAAAARLDQPPPVRAARRRAARRRRADRTPASASGASSTSASPVARAVRLGGRDGGARDATGARAGAGARGRRLERGG